MATLFTKIINGDLPGRFVWRDDEVVSFLTINPITRGHALVVPRREVDHWLDLEPSLLARMTGVAHSIGMALQEAFRPTKVGMIIAGLEVPHVHIHLIPIDRLDDLSFARADRNPDPADLDRAAVQVRDALRRHGAAGVSE